MTWYSVGGVVLLPSVLLAACSGRVDSSSDSPASSSGGRASAVSGGTSSGGASTPASVGGTTILTINTEPEPTLASTCGNGQLDRNEQCDDGNKTLGDGCSGLCQREPGFECSRIGRPCTDLYRCGNGIVDGKDTCDDGNQTSGDGCDASCSTIEPGWQCRVAGQPCTPQCGDGVRTGGEQCDEGQSNGTFQQGQVAACSLGCARVLLCQSESVTVVCPSVCGNGLLEIYEQCDLGALNDDLRYGGCTSQCKLGPHCGDDVVSGDEACDPGLVPVTTYGHPGCTAACQLARYCGDGIVDTLFGEECDGIQSCDRYCYLFLGP